MKRAAVFAGVIALVVAAAWRGPEAVQQQPPPGRGGGRGGRGARGGPDPDDPAQADVDGAQAGGGRGRGGRGNRGGDAAAKPPDPIAAFAAALAKAPTVGYFWTNEVVGYSIKYAHRIPQPDGGERVILAMDRRLGASSSSWKPAGPATPTDYDFTVVELRVDSKGTGEGKASLATKVIFDNDAKTIALENFAAAPSILQSVKH
jgi:hypothetical protein